MSPRLLETMAGSIPSEFERLCKTNGYRFSRIPNGYLVKDNDNGMWLFLGSPGELTKQVSLVQWRAE